MAREVLQKSAASNRSSSGAEKSLIKNNAGRCLYHYLMYLTQNKVRNSWQCPLENQKRDRRTILGLLAHRPNPKSRNYHLYFLKIAP